MKLLHIVSSNLDDEARYQIAFILSLLQREHRIFTTVSEHSGWTGPDEGIPEGLSNLFSMNAPEPRPISPATPVDSIATARHRIRELDPDSIHFHGTLRRRDIKLLEPFEAVRTIYSAYPGCPMIKESIPSSFWSGGLKWLKQRASAGIVCAESMAIEARSAGGWKKDFWRVIPAAYDLEPFRRAKRNRGRLRALAGWTEEDFVVGCLEGIPQPGGEEELFSFLNRTHRDRPQIRYLIPLSNKGIPNEFLQRIDAEGLGEFVYLIRDPFEWVEFYADVEGILSLSRAVTYPRRLIEALAAGTPVSAPDVGVNTDLLNTVEWPSGTFEAGNLEEIVPGFYFLLERREDFVIQARELKDCVIKHFDPETAGQRFHSIYRELIVSES
jgi:glycosyltransferase involved in cell wall biosynthesis